MAVVIKKHLRWTPSVSPDVVGTRIYVSDPGGNVDLNSQSWDFPMGTSVHDTSHCIIPDDLPGFPQVENLYELGVMAIDDVGNQADMTVLSAPFDFDAPLPVTGLTLSDA